MITADLDTDNIKHQPGHQEMLYAAIEGGGTKFVCAIGCSAGNIYESTVLRTADPVTTLRGCVEFFVAAERKYGAIDSIGFGCFGPLDLRNESSTYGHMLATPKPAWSRADLLSQLRDRFAVPIAIDTDVAVAALAEWRMGSGRGCASVAYVTVGTGIGADCAPHDSLVKRLMHTEMGHILVRRHPRDTFPGICPFHGDCLEGLASGPAIYKRWGCELGALPRQHEAWSIVSSYLGQLAATMALMLPVERIIFGGGVMTSGHVLTDIRAAVTVSLNGYLQFLSDNESLERFITGPELAGRAGIVGALLLAETMSPGH